MSKYRLIGDYAISEVISAKDESSITVRVPLITESGSFLHGIENALRELKKNEIHPTEDGFDILALATLVYLADTRISRSGRVK